jgi:FMN reductase
MIRQLMHVLGIGGSLRPGSHSTQALLLALGGAASAGATTTIMVGESLRLPLCDGEHPPEGQAGDDVRALRVAAMHADALIWATPEYHGSMSSVLKNALDWLGREQLRGKPIGLVAVAGGAFGGLEALTTLRVVARSVHAIAVVDQAVVPFASKAFADPPDPKLQARLEAVGAAVVRMATQLH